MSWLSSSFANSMRIDDDNADGNHFQPLSLPPHRRREKPPEESERGDSNGDLRGVKDDLNEFRDSFTRQLLGVANFLAPPPPASSSSSQSHFQRVANEPTRFESSDPSVYGDDDVESSVSARVSEAKDGNCGENGERILDLRFRPLRSPSWDEDDAYINGAVGLTDEVLAFTANISHHPETWLDFPVEDDEDMEDFPMSESQKKHAQAIEYLTPRLTALRIELCPAHMSVGFFWKVYFVLLHSRLNKEDATLLSTPEVVEARAKWMTDQNKRAKKDSDWFHGGLYSRASDEDCTPRSLQNDHSETFSSWTFASEPATSSTTVDSDMEKHVSTDSQFIDRSIIDGKPLEETDNKHLFLNPFSKRPVFSFVNNADDESDEWPEDDCLDQSAKLIPVGITDDVSFSDLEDDDCSIPVLSKP